MIPGGHLGEHIKEHGMMGLDGSTNVVDDGTYWVFKVGGTTLFKVKKSNGNMEIAGSFQAGQTL